MADEKKEPTDAEKAEIEAQNGSDGPEDTVEPKEVKYE